MPSRPRAGSQNPALPGFPQPEPQRTLYVTSLRSPYLSSPSLACELQKQKPPFACSYSLLHVYSEQHFLRVLWGRSMSMFNTIIDRTLTIHVRLRLEEDPLIPSKLFANMIAFNQRLGSQPSMQGYTKTCSMQRRRPLPALSKTGLWLSLRVSLMPARQGARRWTFH